MEGLPQREGGTERYRGDTRTAARRCSSRGPPEPRGALRGSKAAPGPGGITALQCYEAATEHPPVPQGHARGRRGCGGPQTLSIPALGAPVPGCCRPGGSRYERGGGGQRCTTPTRKPRRPTAPGPPRPQSRRGPPPRGSRIPHSSGGAPVPPPPPAAAAQGSRPPPGPHLAEGEEVVAEPLAVRLGALPPEPKLHHGGAGGARFGTGRRRAGPVIPGQTLPLPAVPLPVAVPVRCRSRCGRPPRSERRAPRAEPRAGTAAAGRGVALTDSASCQSARVRTHGAAAPSFPRCACAGAGGAGSCSSLSRSPSRQPIDFSLFFFPPSFFRIFFFLFRVGPRGGGGTSRPLILAAEGAGAHRTERPRAGLTRGAAGPGPAESGGRRAQGWASTPR